MPVTPTFCARRSTGASASPAVGAGRHSAPARGPARWSTWRLATWTPSCRTVGATTAARLAVLVGSSVPTPPWSTACRWCAVWPRIRYGRDADAHGRPLERAACWGSSPPSGRCRWGRCRSSPACSAPGECPTSALDPPPIKATHQRARALWCAVRLCGSTAWRPLRTIRLSHEPGTRDVTAQARPTHPGAEVGPT
jgi:hypothetical protein